MNYLFYSLKMSELTEFVMKRTASFDSISRRKLYGLDAFYICNKPFVVITHDQKIAIKVEDFLVKNKITEISQVKPWTLNDKTMENWFLMPEAFNKKKNKLTPILEMASEVLLRPKKVNRKNKKRRKAHKKSSNESKNNISQEADKKRTFFQKLFKLK